MRSKGSNVRKSRSVFVIFYLTLKVLKNICTISADRKTQDRSPNTRNTIFSFVCHFQFAIVELLITSRTVPYFLLL